jgi:hypothetical protein
MSGNVQKMYTNLTVASTCPIVISPSDAILSYATADTIARASPVGAGFRVCAPTIYGLTQVYTTAGAGACCGTNTQPSTQNQLSTQLHLMGYN